MCMASAFSTVLPLWHLCLNLIPTNSMSGYRVARTKEEWGMRICCKEINFRASCGGEEHYTEGGNKRRHGA